MSLKFRGLLTLAFAIVVANGALAAETKRPNNLILFVADGLRALSVTADTAPAMAAVREVGVNFKNPHSVFPTFTTANASAMATGHQLGDTGNYSNTFYVGRPTESAGGSVTPTVNSSRVRRELDLFIMQRKRPSGENPISWPGEKILSNVTSQWSLSIFLTGYWFGAFLLN